MIRKLLNYTLQPTVKWLHMYFNCEPVYREWYYKYSNRLLKFKDIHKGEDCFIIGNGPSLNKMDLSPLKNYHTFGLNKIFLIFDRVDLNLTYHVAVNPLVIEQSITEIESLQCPSFLAANDALGKVRPLSHINYLIYGGPVMFNKDLIGYVHGHTVTFVAMQIAYYMGFKRVFLIGVDHNFKVNGLPNEKQLLTGKDPNHFDSSYFSGKEWHLPDLDASELDYRLAEFYYRRDGRQIIDATVGGKLQIFSKVSYEKALELCGRK